VSHVLNLGVQTFPSHPQTFFREHTVYFYRQSDSLIESLCDYVGPALAAGKAALVVSTKAHLKGLQARLLARGVSTQKASQQGRYVALDAVEVLSKIMVDGLPDASRFDEIVGGIIAGTRAVVKDPNSEVAIFGEMVSLLSARGRLKAAIRLEQLWNELATKYAFSLRCGYPIANFGGEENAQALIRVCAEHSAVYFDQSDESPNPGNLRIALHKSEERFRLLVDAIQDYAIFLLDPRGHVSSWNKSAERIKGYTASEIIGEHFSIFYPEEDRQSGKPQRELEIATAEGRLEDEGWRLRKDGSRFWANVIITRIRDDAGRLLGFGKVTRDFTERIRADQALQQEIEERREAERKLRLSEKSLRQLSVCLLQSQDEERRRIGRDLHDSVGQYLAAVKMKLDSLKSCAERNQVTDIKGLTECAQFTDEAIKDVRTISYLLYPPLLEELGLKSAITWYVDGFTERSGIQTTVEIAADIGRMPHNLEVALFRVLQESLTNVHRHSGSPTAIVHLLSSNNIVTLQVIDKGQGIRAETLEHSGQDWTSALGVGLRGINERIRQLGGSLEVSSHAGGTTITATVPLSGTEAKRLQSD
jgi:PAS domain S-box-containing protein